MNSGQFIAGTPFPNHSLSPSALSACVFGGHTQQRSGPSVVFTLWMSDIQHRSGHIQSKCPPCYTTVPAPATLLSSPPPPLLSFRHFSLSQLFQCGHMESDASIWAISSSTWLTMRQEGWGTTGTCNAQVLLWFYLVHSIKIFLYFFKKFTSF